MNILILGSEGFIGTHCVNHFKKANGLVYGADLVEQSSFIYNYTQVSRLSSEIDDLFSQTQFDAVINAAGSGNVPYSMLHPLLDFESNSLDTIRGLEAIRKHQPECRYLYISSAAVYGNPQQLPIKEDDPLEPVSPYGWHKLIAEQLCREYTSLYGMKTAIVRPFSVYGPGLRKQLFWDWHQKAKRGNGTVELIGTGKENRDYIYVKDLVGAIGLILQKGKLQGEVYNLASGQETTIDDVAKLFFKGLNMPVQYSYNGTLRAGDPLNWCADITALKDLGFQHDYDLQRGIGELLSWLNNV